MSDQVRPSSGNGSGGGRFPLRTRTLAILIMVAGAAGFVVARLAFGDQILCLLGSTLVVFLGLGIILYNRRLGGASSAVGRPAQQPPVQGQAPIFRRGIPPGLRDAARRPAAPPRPVEQPAPGPVETTEPEEVSFPGEVVSLVDHVTRLLESQGAQVQIETQRGGEGASRGILRVYSQAGQVYTMLVLEGEEPVDVSDVRALYALVNSGGGDGGYLISSAPYTRQAYDWASARKIRLVREDELDELSL